MPNNKNEKKAAIRRQRGLREYGNRHNVQSAIRRGEIKKLGKKTGSPLEKRIRKTEKNLGHNK